MTSNPFADMPGSFDERLNRLRPGPGSGQPSESVEQASPQPAAEPARKPAEPAEPAAREEPVAAQEAAEPQRRQEPAPEPPADVRGPEHPQGASQALTMARRNAAARAADEVDEELESKEGTTTVKEFPNSLVKELRERLMVAGVRPTKGLTGPFAQTRVLVGYMVATLGLSEEGLDEDTKVVVRAFRVADPVLSLLQDIAGALNKQSSLLRTMSSAAQQGTVTTDVIELGVAYLLAERTGVLDTAHVQPSTIDMTQRLVLQARRQAQNEHRKLKQREDAEKGRPLR